MANQFRNYLLTVNNPTETDEQFFEKCKGLPDVKYFVFQREKGEEKGTEHFQLYIEFTYGKKFTVMKDYFKTAHIESRKGTKTQARDYCRKEDTRIGQVYEYGEFAEERERTDITDIISLFAKGATVDEVADAFPKQFFHYGRRFEELRQRYLEKTYGSTRRDNIEVIYIYGETGVGKTTFVNDTYGFDRIYSGVQYDSRNGEKFDGYCDQNVLLLDEFRSQIAFANLLKYIGRDPVWLPARYYPRVACYTKVYILSNWTLFEQYTDVQRTHPKDWDAFLRRIKFYYNYDISKTDPIPRNMWRSLALKNSDDLPF